MLKVLGFDIGIKNFAYCIMSKENSKIKLEELKKVDLQCNKKDIQKIIDATIDILDVIFESIEDDADEVVILIESQMTSIMKCIQTVINTYFKIHGRYRSLNITTKNVSAKHKLNLIDAYKDTYIKPLESSNASNQYRQNKIDSVNFAKWLLETKYTDNEVVSDFLISKKKDDFADAFLMTVYYLEIVCGIQNKKSPKHK